MMCGSLDPERVVKQGSPKSVSAAVASCHREASERFIIKADFEVPHETPPAHVCVTGAYVEAHWP
jgi:uroporphyrinogen-III decarboxylase